MYALRITNNTEDSEVWRQLVTSTIKGLSSVWAYCYETGKDTELEHAHAYLENLFIQPQSVRLKLSKLFGKGNQNYSLKLVKDQTKYIAYMMKEGEFHSNLPTNVLQDASAYDHKVKVSRAKTRTTMEALRKICEEKNLYTINEIAKEVVDYYSSNDLLFREHLVQSQVQTLCIKHVPKFRDYTVWQQSSKYESFDYFVSKQSALLRRPFSDPIVREGGDKPF